MTDAERNRWLLKYLMRNGLMSEDYCQPGAGMTPATYWVLRAPAVIDGGAVLGYAKTAEGAIDAAANSEPAVRELTGAEAEQAWAAATRPGGL